MNWHTARTVGLGAIRGALVAVSATAGVVAWAFVGVWLCEHLGEVALLFFAAVTVGVVVGAARSEAPHG